MTSLHVTPDLEMHYSVEDFTDPWRKPEAILLLHGNHESSAAWYGWVPHLARHYKVVRADMRGFGLSTPMPRDFPWTLATVLGDFIQLMDSLGIDRFHLVGAKIGGILGRAFAGVYPERVRTLTVVGTPPPARPILSAEELAGRLKEIEEHGLEPWARRSMAKRLGGAFPPEGVEWWIKFMARTPRSTDLGFYGPMNNVRLKEDDLSKIKCPMLVIVAQGSAQASVEKTREWQEQVPNSKLVVLPGDSFHVAVTDSERCAQATLEFIARHSKAA